MTAHNHKYVKKKLWTDMSQKANTGGITGNLNFSSVCLVLNFFSIRREVICIKKKSGQLDGCGRVSLRREHYW